MTEIMVIDSISKDTKKYDRRMKYRFMEEWISKSQKSFSPAFIERGLHLGIDVRKPYRAAVLYFADYQELSDTLDGQRLLDDMETSIRHEMERQNILYLREPESQLLHTQTRMEIPSMVLLPLSETDFPVHSQVWVS